MNKIYYTPIKRIKLAKIAFISFLLIAVIITFLSKEYIFCLLGILVAKLFFQLLYLPKYKDRLIMRMKLHPTEKEQNQIIQEDLEENTMVKKLASWSFFIVFIVLYIIYDSLKSPLLNLGVCFLTIVFFLAYVELKKIHQYSVKQGGEEK